MIISKPKSNSEVAPEPQGKQTIILDTGGKAKIHGQYDHSQQGKWWIKLSIDDFLTMQFAEYINLNFVIGGYIYFAKANNVGIHKDKQVLVLSPPKIHESRPLRDHQRIDTRLETALIIPSTDYRPSQFIRRTENIILNISLGGTQLACSNALPEGITNVLLLMGLDQNSPMEKDSQIYCSGIIKRVTKETHSSAYPYIYGISFKPLPPLFKFMLANFIEVSGITSDKTNTYNQDKVA